MSKIQERVKVIKDSYNEMARKNGTHCICCFIQYEDDIETHIGFFPHLDDAQFFIETFLNEKPENNKCKAYLNDITVYCSSGFGDMPQ